MPFGFGCCTSDDVAESPSAAPTTPVQRKPKPFTAPAPVTESRSGAPQPHPEVKIPRTVRTFFAPWPQAKNNTLMCTPPAALRVLAEPDSRDVSSSSSASADGGPAVAPAESLHRPSIPMVVVVPP